MSIFLQTYKWRYKDNMTALLMFMMLISSAIGEQVQLNCPFRTFLCPSSDKCCDSSSQTRVEKSPICEDMSLTSEDKDKICCETLSKNDRATRPRLLQVCQNRLGLVAWSSYCKDVIRKKVQRNCPFGKFLCPSSDMCCDSSSQKCSEKSGTCERMFFTSEDMDKICCETLNKSDSTSRPGLLQVCQNRLGLVAWSSYCQAGEQVHRNCSFGTFFGPPHDMCCDSSSQICSEESPICEDIFLKSEDMDKICCETLSKNLSTTRPGLLQVYLNRLGLIAWPSYCKVVNGRVTVEDTLNTTCNQTHVCPSSGSCCKTETEFCSQQSGACKSVFNDDDDKDEVCCDVLSRNDTTREGLLSKCQNRLGTVAWHGYCKGSTISNLSIVLIVVVVVLSIIVVILLYFLYKYLAGRRNGPECGPQPADSNDGCKETDPDKETTDDEQETNSKILPLIDQNNDKDVHEPNNVEGTGKNPETQQVTDGGSINGFGQIIRQSETRSEESPFEHKVEIHASNDVAYVAQDAQGCDEDGNDAISTESSPLVEDHTGTENLKKLARSLE